MNSFFSKKFTILRFSRLLFHFQLYCLTLIYQIDTCNIHHTQISPVLSIHVTFFPSSMRNRHVTARRNLYTQYTVVIVLLLTPVKRVTTLTDMQTVTIKEAYVRNIRDLDLQIFSLSLSLFQCKSV